MLSEGYILFQSLDMLVMIIANCFVIGFYRHPSPTSSLGAILVFDEPPDFPGPLFPMILATSILTSILTSSFFAPSAYVLSSSSWEGGTRREHHLHRTPRREAFDERDAAFVVGIPIDCTLSEQPQ